MLCNSNNKKIIWGLITQDWEKVEQAWFDLISKTYSGKDMIQMYIFVPNNDGLNKANIEKHVINHSLLQMNDPPEIYCQETQNIPEIICDYWLETSYYQQHKNDLKSHYGTIHSPNLPDLEKAYSNFFENKNAYEYDFLVNAYDFERSGKGFTQTEHGLVPIQFGSSGGTRFENILKDMNTYCKKNDHILEIGCGAGAFYKTLAVNQKSYFYTGCDVSRKQIRRCQKNYPSVDFKVENACCLSIPNDAYEFIFENNVIIFITDPLKAIEEMCRVSKKYISFSIHVLHDEIGLYCYYPFTHTCAINPLTKQIAINEDEKRFFKGSFDVNHITENKVSATRVKTPTYVPSRNELYQFIDELLLKFHLSIIRKNESGKIQKAVFINDFKVFASIFIPDIPDYLYFGRDIIKLFRDFLAHTGFKAPALTLFFNVGFV